MDTFLNKDSNRNLFKRAIGYSQKAGSSVFTQVPTIKMASEKVADTVATFLNNDNNESFF